jgi:hypothetical protein
MSLSFITWCPMAFNPSSGGILALHKLTHNLALLGEKSYITTAQKNPAYLGEQITEEQAHRFDKNSTIVLYPEIVTGNPYNAKHVMRWILNTLA